MKTFTEQGKIKAVEKAIRVLKQEENLTYKIWGNYEDFIQHFQGIPGKEDLVEEVLHAQEEVELESYKLTRTVDALQAFVNEWSVRNGKRV